MPAYADMTKNDVFRKIKKSRLGFYYG